MSRFVAAKSPLKQISQIITCLLFSVPSIVLSLYSPSSKRNHSNRKLPAVFPHEYLWRTDEVRKGSRPEFLSLGISVTGTSSENIYSTDLANMAAGFVSSKTLHELLAPSKCSSQRSFLPCSPLPPSYTALQLAHSQTSFLVSSPYLRPQCSPRP